MPDQVQTDIIAVPHPLENAAQRIDCCLRNIGHAGRETNWRHNVCELDGFQLVRNDLSRFEHIPLFGLKKVRILCPLHEWLVSRQMPFDSLSNRSFLDALCYRRRCGQRRAHQQTITSLRHPDHLLAGPRASGASEGAPSRQYTSGSTTSS